jgi:K+-sensing histidine kinase KdpD
VQISLEDSGQGLRPLFCRTSSNASASRIRPPRASFGLGLGLSIARHLVELHGGTISAASEGDGKGAKFVVRLPVGPRFAAVARTADRRTDGVRLTE